MYYIVSKNLRITRAAVHFGNHKHLVADGESREAIGEIYDVVKA